MKPILGNNPTGGWGQVSGGPGGKRVAIGLGEHDVMPGGLDIGTGEPGVAQRGMTANMFEHARIIH